MLYTVSSRTARARQKPFLEHPHKRKKRSIQSDIHKWLTIDAYTCMYTIPTGEKDGRILKETEEGYMKRFRGRKGKGEML